ncbi:hypothetical protein [Nonomuraea africana]|uniref:Lipoprotein n=1 Tax=Nonomuraea africana TaxID=46171 RepID=A0ABR9KPD8_9ACTN|nr:hypothetical protein [Nonomuraea africana]MBE1563888.1 hypothetical protein [Nonomuraea africana]
MDELLRNVRAAVVLLLLSATLAGCQVWGMLGGGRELCERRADRVNAMVREAISPALPPASQILSIGGVNDCDSSTYGAWVFVELKEEEDLRARFVAAGWSADLEVDAANAYDLAKRIGDRVFGVSIESNVEISAVVLDGCWDSGGYGCG